MRAIMDDFMMRAAVCRFVLLYFEVRDSEVMSSCAALQRDCKVAQLAAPSSRNLPERATFCSSYGGFTPKPNFGSFV
jgi:hypothetical protein